MERGWGLTLDSSDRFFRLNHAKSAMFSGDGFPVNLTYKEEPAGSPPVDENRVAGISEVDFFSSKPNQPFDSKIVNNNVIVKKENSRNDEATPMNDSDSNVNTGLRLLTANTRSDESTVDDGVSSNGDDTRAKTELTRLQIELERMNTENQRLRGMLTQVSNNYNSLQMQMITLMQQQQNSTKDSTQQHKIIDGKLGDKKEQIRLFIDHVGPSGTAEEDETSNNNTSSEEKTQSASPINRHTNNEIVGYEKEKTNLRDGKRIGREETPESESWVPNKVTKLVATKAVDQATESTMRKARVSVRARSEAPMITDGCQWRKYGQKMAKGNPCPRAYYRCTMAVGCPVRKQVQRCAEDRTILITTYEGNHNHPLPPAAMAMASTTSAAANMLLSGSMSSADGLMNPNFLARAIFPSNSSMATISASAPFPTVTLDLTHSPNPLQIQRPQSQVQVPSQLPQIFGQPLYNQSQFSGLQMSQNMDSSQLAHQGPPPQLSPSFADTLSVATAAITSDPNFTAALAAAITSIMGGSHTNKNNNNNISDNSNHTRSSTFTGN